MRKFTPRPYQALIIDAILSRKRIAIWAGMGMGKTVSTLTAIRIAQTMGEGPALVIAPVRVAQSSWPDEVEKWDHLRGKPITARKWSSNSLRLVV